MSKASYGRSFKVFLLPNRESINLVSGTTSSCSLEVIA